MTIVENIKNGENNKIIIINDENKNITYGRE